MQAAGADVSRLQTRHRRAATTERNLQGTPVRRLLSVAVSKNPAGSAQNLEWLLQFNAAHANLLYFFEPLRG